MSRHGGLAVGDPVSRVARPAGAAANEPVIVLTCSHSGVEVLNDLLSGFPSLACTSRTGLLPMCEAVAATWRRVEGRASLSSLAVASIRALAISMSCAVTADSGALRWCETALSGTVAAETFLKVFPGAKFICFYRRCDEVISEAIDSNPWGLGGTEFWQYSSAAPGNSVAMIGAYWADGTKALLDFERAQPSSCMGVRHEDLAADAPAQMRAICSFLGLTPSNATMHQNEQAWKPPSGPDGRPLFPADRFPPRLLTMVNDLHDRLGYPLL
jgi:protein-tyrosine sulfotransferase